MAATGAGGDGGRFPIKVIKDKPKGWSHFFHGVLKYTIGEGVLLHGFLRIRKLLIPSNGNLKVHVAGAIATHWNMFPCK